MKTGDTVKLKEEIKQTYKCPPGRNDYSTSVVQNIFGIDNDEVKVYPDLHGCQYWNKKDLIVVKNN